MNEFKHVFKDLYFYELCPDAFVSTPFSYEDLDDLWMTEKKLI